MGETIDAPFLEFLEEGRARGGFETDDVLAAVLPLMKQVLATHAAGLAAPLEGIQDLSVTEQRHLAFTPAKAGPPQKNTAKVEAVQPPVSRGIEVVGEARRTADLDKGSLLVSDLGVAGTADGISRPVYLP